jgi:ABC-type Co2+ transport system permease subunit
MTTDTIALHMSDGIVNAPISAVFGVVAAAILVGPWLGALCVGIVLVVQALLFADGGPTALGTNITNMALIGTWTASSRS